MIKNSPTKLLVPGNSKKINHKIKNAIISKREIEELALLAWTQDFTFKNR
jgi:hypothetical protein